MEKIVGYHIIFGAYGFWLPNDPRGSWSDFVGAWELFRFGQATRTTERRSLARDEHDQEKRLAAKSALKLPSVLFSADQILTVGEGIAEVVVKSQLQIWACSIMPEHVHCVLARDRLSAEQLSIQIKGGATRAMVLAGNHPFLAHARTGQRPPKTWERGEWKVFLHNEGEVQKAIKYVEDNPIREGLPPQHWEFVTKLA